MVRATGDGEIFCPDGPPFNYLGLTYCVDHKYHQLVMAATDHIGANVFMSKQKWKELQEVQGEVRRELCKQKVCKSQLDDKCHEAQVQFFEQHAPDQVNFLRQRIDLFEKQFTEEFLTKIHKRFNEGKAEHEYQHWKRLVMEAEDLEGNAVLYASDWFRIANSEEMKRINEQWRNKEVTEEEFQKERKRIRYQYLHEMVPEQYNIMNEEVLYCESKLDPVKLEQFRERLVQEKADPNHNYATGGYYNDRFLDYMR
jgi:hypothetical protein